MQNIKALWSNAVQFKGYRDTKGSVTACSVPAAARGSLICSHYIGAGSIPPSLLPFSPLSFSLPSQGTEQVQYFSSVFKWFNPVALGNVFHLFSSTHFKTFSIKTAWRNKEFRKFYSPDQWDSSITPIKWVSGYR